MDHYNDCYDWPITGYPGWVIDESGLDSTPDGRYGEEYWKPTDLRGVFVSNCGRFYDTEQKRFLTIHTMNTGYEEVKKYYDGKQHHLSVHKAIANAFIDNPNNYPVVRHLDDDKNNNDLSNLAFGTYKDNHEDAVLNGRFVPLDNDSIKKAYEKRSRSIVATNLTTGEETKFKSMHDAARNLGIAVESICNIVNRVKNHKTSGGYTFRAS